MLDTSRVDKELAAARQFAGQFGLAENLERQLTVLEHFGGKDRSTRCTLFHDFAPYSFAFQMEVQKKDGTWVDWFNGGLIFHGAHDGGGCGCLPTLAVSLTPTTGWSIHT